MKKHRNIPIFVPHLGCPNTCVFCNQRKISGHTKADLSSVKAEIEEAFATVPAGVEVQIAFFGGSFTGIDREDMIYLLETAKGFIDEGRVQSIRLSTRPDYIDEEILDILSRYGVRSIELGIQSMKNEVLAASGRGHTAEQTERACRLICERGFELVGQMMTGLPGADIESEVYTAEKICDMGASGARIYPTVVFCDTELAAMAKRGEYTAREMEKVVADGAKVLEVFLRRGVKVIRIGLQSSELLVGGTQTMSPYHEATGEFIWSRCYRDMLEEKLSCEDAKGKLLTVFVPKGAVSKMVGQKRENEIYLKERTGFFAMKVREKEELQDSVEIVLEERTK